LSGASFSLTVALAGNPNSGKTTLFNVLTGGHRHVGNWPGVTVEKWEGRATLDGTHIRVVDLPGVYCLSGTSEDQRVARDYLLGGETDIVVSVVDATDLARHLGLTLELLEVGLPVVVALNMTDLASRRGLVIDRSALAARLGVPVVATVATTGDGVEELLRQVVSAARERPARMRPRPMVVTRPRATVGTPGSGAAGEDLVAYLAQRQALAEEIAGEVVSRPPEAEAQSPSDRIDRFLTHRYWGVLVLLVTLGVVLSVTFAVGIPLSDALTSLIHRGGRAGATFLERAGAPRVLVSLLFDGVVAGVGAVLAFVPPVTVLYLFLAFLEDSGYMARAALVSERLMRVAHLEGRAFIPMVIGLGCSVPAVLATRTLESRAGRLATMLAVPFVSCSARLPVYTLLAGSLLPGWSGLSVLGVYTLGLSVAVLVARLLSVRVLKAEEPPLVIELPPWRIPLPRTLGSQAWHRVRAFLGKAGTVIVLGVVVMWVLASLPWGVRYAGERSLLGRVGSLIAPFLAPAGFGTPQVAVALAFGLLAKEFVVAGLGLAYGVEGDILPEVLGRTFTPLAAVSFMVMTLLYSPCLATLAAIRKESGSWRWSLLAFAGSVVVAWTAATVVYQVGRVLGLD